MGIDFLRKCAPSFKRGYDKALKDLTESDLFDCAPELKDRTYEAIPADGRAFESGTQLLARLDGSTVHILDGQVLIGVLSDPPAALITTLRDAGHEVAVVTVQCVHPISGGADVTIH